MAVLVALLASVLFGVGALGVDLTNAMSRQQMSQSAADLAALAGAAGLGQSDVTRARTLALAYLTDNKVRSDDGSPFPSCGTPVSPQSPRCWDNDGVPANGEISFYNSAGYQTTGRDAVRIRVIVPRRKVTFGLAAAIGFRDVSVQRAATAGVYSPVLTPGTPPFYLVAGQTGLTCLTRDGGDNQGDQNNQGDEGDQGDQGDEGNKRVGDCPASTVDRGYLPIPRDDSTGQDAVVANIATGVQPLLRVNGGEGCAGSESPGASAIDCVPVQGGPVPGWAAGFFSLGPPAGRMRQPEAGANTGKVAGNYPIDIDHVNEPRFVDSSKGSPGDLEAALRAGQPPRPDQRGWLTAAVLRSPRFAMLPVVDPNVDRDGDASPIVGFVGFFIDSPSSDTAADHGFVFNGDQLRAVKGYAFSLDYLPETLPPSAAPATSEYAGSGPKVVRLIHDSGDPPY